jgi:hypothetical protein
VRIYRSARELLSGIGGESNDLIAIDGWHGSGKSWLARTLGVCLNRPRFDLDAALARNRGGFIEHLDLLSIEQFLQAHPRSVLSGVCMKDVLARLGSRTTTLIYVKRMHLGIWTHEAEANGDFADYRLIDQFAAPGPLELEVRQYHLRWKPHETADVVLERRCAKRTGL